MKLKKIKQDIELAIWLLSTPFEYWSESHARLFPAPGRSQPTSPGPRRRLNGMEATCGKRLLATKLTIKFFSIAVDVVRVIWIDYAIIADSRKAVHVSIAGFARGMDRVPRGDHSVVT